MWREGLGTRTTLTPLGPTFMDVVPRIPAWCTFVNRANKYLYIGFRLKKYMSGVRGDSKSGKCV